MLLPEIMFACNKNEIGSAAAGAEKLVIPAFHPKIIELIRDIDLLTVNDGVDCLDSNNCIFIKTLSSLNHLSLLYLIPLCFTASHLFYLIVHYLVNLD